MSMDDETQEPKVEVSDSTRGFDYWLSRDFVSEGLREQLRDKQVLLVPHENWRNSESPLFADGTQGLFEFLKEHLPNETPPEVCIEDEDYAEVALYSATVALGVIVLTAFAAPLAVKVIGDYITKRFPERTRMTVELIIEEKNGDTKTTKSIKYEGEPKALEVEVAKLLPKLEERKPIASDPDYPKEPKK